MPAIIVDNPLVLPRVPRPEPGSTTDRPVRQVVASLKQTEGGGFQVARPFPGPVSPADSDPFLLLDHVGPLVNGPEEAVGHRGIHTAGSRPSPTCWTVRSPITTRTAVAGSSVKARPSG